MEEKLISAYKKSKNIYDDILTQNRWWSKLYIRLFWGVDDTKITMNLLAMLPNDFAGALLDVPCGTLNLTVDKYLEMEQSRIVCLDYSKDMLAVAKERIRSLSLSHVSAIQGDVGDLPFENETFDIVLSMNGFHAFPDKESAFYETARVLKPGGLFLGCFYICGEHRRSDFVVKTVLARKGWFTPPFQTKTCVLDTLNKYYSVVELYSDKAMVWFRCVK